MNLRLLATLLIVIMTAKGVTCKDHIWRRVFVSQSRLAPPIHRQRFAIPPSALPRNLRCSAVCQLQEWCKLWCQDPTAPFTACLLSDVIVMPAYHETHEADVLTCYTRRHVDFVTNGTIVGSPDKEDYPSRKMENLVDGFYGYTMSECFLTISTKNPWFTVDICEVKPISLVRIIFQNNINAELHTDYEVRLGRVEVPEHELHNHTRMGYFAGPATKGEEVLFSVPEPILARYVTVRRLVVGELQLCHIEVY